MSQQSYNRLKNETSPYLLQHATNPVDWYPWGEEALQKARDEYKLLIVSIGYSACHWCHVMEHESFEDQEVAALMNRNFVCVKVDREERPDVDNVYMDAVHLMGQQGGWPLNCICLPDGRPIYGGTYFPKENWLSILQKVNEVYKTDNKSVLEYAENLSVGMKQQALVLASKTSVSLSKEDLTGMVQTWSESFDSVHGGNQGSPKFPMPSTLLFLLRYYFFSNKPEIKDFIELTLDKMAAGGIYDHLGGGFARYSTDEEWRVPHFEKMLYDNAQLVSVYSEAYKLFRKQRYKEVVYETLAFIERELADEDGGFYAALDADTEGIEGKFYVWSYEEILKALGEEDGQLFCRFYDVHKGGNWEQGINVLHQKVSAEAFAKTSGRIEKEVKDIINRARTILFELRSKRVAPTKDTKILSSWNALCISAYANAYAAFNDGHFKNRANELVEFLKSSGLIHNDKVYRMKKNDGSYVSGFLDDYAILAKAFIDMYQSGFGETFLHEASTITKSAYRDFLDDGLGFFSYSAKNEEQLFSAKYELSDNVIPSSNSVMAHVLNQMGLYFDIEEWTDLSRSMLNKVAESMQKNGRYFSNWAILACYESFNWSEVVIIGENSKELAEKLNREYGYYTLAASNSDSNLPLFAHRHVEGKTPLYVCRNKTCKLPVYSLAEAKSLLLTE